MTSITPDLSSRFGAVVLLEVSYVEPEYLRPWQKSRQGACTGTGFIVPDDDELLGDDDAGNGSDEPPPASGRRRRLLTNLHVVQDATDIRVRKHGHARRWRAEVVCMAADLDLAVLQIVSEDDDDIKAFWGEGGSDSDGKDSSDGAETSSGNSNGAMMPIQWARDGPPLLQSSVNVVGYPTGGRTICVTEGVVSRIDCRNYRIKTAGAAPGKLLVIQIDAAINPGNSGGPCFDDEGRVVGVAFQGLDGGDAQNVGYIIPANTALNFLDAIERDATTGKCDYRGVQEIPYRWANLHNKSLRKFLQFTGNSGVVITKVSPLAEAAEAKKGKDCNFFKANDVLTHIDGKELGEDYTVALRGDELMNADFLLTGKRKGEPTAFRVVRDTKPLEFTTTLRPLTPKIPRNHGIDCTPEWLVIGGLLFVPLTCPLLSYGSTKELETSGYLNIYDYMDDTISEFREKEGTEIILLIDILACDTNYGYEFKQSWRKLDTLNGVELKSMAHLYGMYHDACQSVEQKAKAAAKTSAEGEVGITAEAEAEFLKFVFKDKSRIVVETVECVTSESEVLSQHGIPEAASSGVLDAWQRGREEKKAAVTSTEEKESGTA